MENPAEETCCHPNQNFKIFWTIATCLSFVNSIIGTPAREVKSGRDFRPGTGPGLASGAVPAWIVHRWTVRR